MMTHTQSRQSLTSLTVLLALFTLVALPREATAIDACKARVDSNSGHIELSAKSVSGTVRWGLSPNTIEGDFYDVGTCITSGKMKDCIPMGGATTGVALPTSCTFFMEDLTSSCAAFVRGCTPRPLDKGLDGVVLIDQQRALAGGITPGDGPGFPVVLDTPGSYRLTGDLDVSAAGAAAIDIATSDVTVDLGGHVVSGGVAGCPLDCPATVFPALSGIRTSSLLLDNVRILNGTIKGMPGHGIQLEIGGAVVLRDLRLLENAGHGIKVANIGTFPVGVIVDRCEARGNGYSGYQAEPSTRHKVMLRATSNLFADNYSVGAENVTGLFEGNVVIGPHRHYGVEVSGYSLLVNNTISRNTIDGVRLSGASSPGVPEGSLFVGNTIVSNVTGAGIHATEDAGALLLDNVITSNGNYGVNWGVGTVTPVAGFGRNVIQNNASGTLNGITNPGGVIVNVAPNLCDGSTTCP